MAIAIAITTAITETTLGCSISTINLTTKAIYTSTYENRVH